MTQKMLKKSILIFLIIINSIFVFGQTKTEINVPKFCDEYSKTIKNLELGKTDIDYKKFRESFIQSKQFKIATEQKTELNNLKKEMFEKMSKSEIDSVIGITKKMLSIDYTNMTAQKVLRQSYKIVGDTINAKKHKAIQFGLLKSIVNNGDGKSCETGWSVIQISEEYFILEMLEAKVIKQSLDNENGICDRMEVEINGEKKIYYFEISKVFKGREKLKEKQ
jgi:hypothetical protein